MEKFIRKKIAEFETRRNSLTNLQTKISNGCKLRAFKEILEYIKNHKIYTQQQVDELLDRKVCETTAQMLENQKLLYTEEQVRWRCKASVEMYMYDDSLDHDELMIEWEKWYELNKKA